MAHAEAKEYLSRHEMVEAMFWRQCRGNEQGEGENEKTWEDRKENVHVLNCEVQGTSYLMTAPVIKSTVKDTLCRCQLIPSRKK